MSHSAMQFDTSTLGTPMSTQEANDLNQRRRSGEFGSTSTPMAGFVIAVFVVVLTTMAIVFGVVISLLASSSSGFPWGSLTPGVLPIGVLVLVFVPWLVRRHNQRRNWREVARFADRNHLVFRLASADPTYPGLLFDLGTKRAAQHHVYAPSGLFADAGTFVYETGSGDDRSTSVWNFAAFRLPAPMPHLVLDSRENDSMGLSNLPVGFATSQQVPLPAPLSERYRLYAPDGYGPDALYLFPPMPWSAC